MNRIWLPLFLSIGLMACKPEPTHGNASEPEVQTAKFAREEVDSAPAEEVVPPEPARVPMPLEALLGRINPAKDSNFVRIEPQFTTKSGIYLRKETYQAFKEMHAAAKEDGINLKIVSATRTFGAQKGIWERKWTGVTKVGGNNLTVSEPEPAGRASAILTYSSMPGTSRHHWGTDIDLNNLNNSWFASGTGKKIYDWLTQHAAEYGFCQTYTPIGEERPHGYLEEKWHWSYMPLSKQFLADYEAHISHEDISGFKGSEVAAELDIISRYVSGINPVCKTH